MIVIKKILLAPESLASRVLELLEVEIPELQRLEVLAVGRDLDSWEEVLSSSESHELNSRVAHVETLVSVIVKGNPVVEVNDHLLQIRGCVNQ